MIHKNLKSKNNSSSVTMQDVANHAESIQNMYVVFHQIVIVLSDLRAGVLNLPRVVDSNRTHSFEHFEAFLQVLECYGMGYNEDIDQRKYKIREKQSHRDTAIYQLRRIIRLYQISID